jgi:beta-ureidopropionase
VNKNPLFSRRNFAKSVVGAGTLGIGTANSSDAHSAVVNPPVVDMNTSPREVLVQSVSNKKFKKDNYEYNIKTVLNTLERTSSYSPDIICLPEVFANHQSNPQAVPGPITHAFSNYAKKHACYVICSLISLRDNKKYNTSVLLNRKGAIVGMYDKIHPTEGECDSDITPGNPKPPVFKTDFGTIGIQICFDINWSNEWKSLREQGAEIVFWPATYPNPKLLSSYASLFGYYVVGTSRIDPCYIYDGTGDLISKSGRYEGWAFASLNLEKIFCEIDFHVKKVKEIRKKYGRKVKIVYYHDSDWVTIESKSPDLTIKQLVDEYGLTSRWDYIKRAEKYQEKFRNG